MIDFGNYYNFPADQVAYIENHKVPGDYPFELAVILKTGNRLAVCYKRKESCDTAKRVLITNIQRELRADTEKTHNMLYLIEDCAKRIDKRQLRIWQQLKALLHITTEIDD